MTAREIAAIAGGQPVGGMISHDLEDGLRTAVTHAFEMRGQRDPDMTTCDAVVAELMRCIHSRYRHFTLPEISLAINAGVCGELDPKTILVTPANAVRWLNLYAESSERAEALRMVRQSRAAEGRKIAGLLSPADERERDEKFRKEAPLNAWQAFKQSPSTYKILVIGYGNALFQALRASGKMQTISEETMAEAEQRAWRRWKQGIDGRSCNKGFADMAEILRNKAGFQAAVNTELVILYFEALYKAGKELIVK